MGKGTGSFGKRRNKTHTLCVRWNFHRQKSRCSSCGYPATRICKCIRRKTTGTGRMRYLRHVPRSSRTISEKVLKQCQERRLQLQLFKLNCFFLASRVSGFLKTQLLNGKTSLDAFCFVCSLISICFWNELISVTLKRVD
ncbi:uncharacterized protein LOC122010193 isoform X2 [Zingiber officinale]|uniref:uncharacterized protein LOC122010193 isoform X2 n=1 Tax=Zingiber officinale TaxID=94328 RepID=UPI001C4C1DB5|nr:uncharacterized protein LOC122010193 isoform X2 [Zingiber officinale]